MQIRLRTYVSQTGSCQCQDETHHAQFLKERPPRKTLALFPVDGSGAIEIEFSIDAQLPKSGTELVLEV